MKKCIQCEVPVSEEPLHRTTPKGSLDPGWTCNNCDPEYKDKNKEIHEVTQLIKKDG